MNAQSVCVRLAGSQRGPVAAAAGLPAVACLVAAAWLAATVAGSAVRPLAAQSPRATSLGGAFWTAGGEGHAIFHHPALMSGSGFAISFGRAHEDVHRDHGHHDARGGRRAGAWAAARSASSSLGADSDRAAQGHRHADDIVLSASGAWFGGTAAAGLATLDGGSGVSQRVAALGFARGAWFGAEVGVVAKVLDGNGRGSLSGTLVDVGAARELGPLTAALSVQNLGRRNGDSDAAGCDPTGQRCWTDRRVVLGAGTGRAPVGPLDVGGAVQVVVDNDGEVVPGGGVEVAWWPILRRVFLARVGLTRVVVEGESPFTFGAGFAGDRFRIDYGYGELGNGLAPHRIGVAIR